MAKQAVDQNALQGAIQRRKHKKHKGDAAQSSGKTIPPWLTKTPGR